MATSVSISPADGYPTQTSMRVDVSFQVTYAATYHTEFEVRKGSSTGTIIQEATGTSFTLSAGGSKKGIFKTFNNLSPGTRYTVVCWLCNSKTQERLVSDELPFTTEADYQQDLVYHSGSATPRRQTIQGDGSIRDGGNFFTAPSGFTFYGWAESTGDKVPDYYAGDSYTATGYDDVHLYAIWKYEDATGVTFYYGYNMSATPNYRKLLGYAYNTSSSSQTTEYESVKTPAMTAGNITVVGRSFSPVGWRGDTKNNGSGLTGGNQYIAVSQSKCVFYAVYQNTSGIHVSYNSNGGSGTMASTTVPGTMYYNTAQTSPTTITVTPRDCTFTPPKGSQFRGWSTRENGEIVTSVSTSYDVTFYARWDSARPGNWQWSGYLYLNGVKKPYNMTAGGRPPMVKQSNGTYYAYYMGAAEWESFRQRVQQFADYLGVSLNSLDYNGASAQAGQPMTKKQARCMANLIDSLNPPQRVPALTNEISASFFMGLQRSLNSIN